MATLSGYVSLCKISARRVNLARLSTFNFKSREEKKKKANREKYKRWAKYAAGGVAITAAIPLAVGALGFGAGGVVAGSMAASMQSAAAGTVLTGGIGVLQSIGAAGLTFSQGALTTVVGSTALSKMSKALFRRKKQNRNGTGSEEKDKENQKSENKSKDDGTGV